MCGAMGECDEKFIFECDVHGVECGHDVECVPRCGAVERFDVKCGVICEMWSDVNVVISDMV